jgi:hypothetical protein
LELYSNTGCLRAMELLRVSNWSVAARRACQAKPYENVDTFTSSLLKSLFTEKEVKLMKRKITGAILICLGLGLLWQAVGQTPEGPPAINSAEIA